MEVRVAVAESESTGPGTADGSVMDDLVYNIWNIFCSVLEVIKQQTCISTAEVVCFLSCRAHIEMLATVCSNWWVNWSLLSTSPLSYFQQNWLHVPGNIIYLHAIGCQKYSY